jgi:hypothetical protein
MLKYKIKRWDVILINNKRFPIIYIKPDIEFIKLMHQNTYFAGQKYLVVSIHEKR